MTSQEKAFLYAIIDNPNDAVTKLVFADWLAEQSDRDDEEFVYRWMAKHGTHPHHRDKYPSSQQQKNGRKVSRQFSWAWWSEISLRYNYLPKYQGIPKHAVLSYSVIHSFTGPNADHRFYPSFENAIIDLCGGLSKLRDQMEI